MVDRSQGEEADGYAQLEILHLKQLEAMQLLKETVLEVAQAALVLHGRIDQLKRAQLRQKEMFVLLTSKGACPEQRSDNMYGK